jgi:hypothetical protein
MGISAFTSILSLNTTNFTCNKSNNCRGDVGNPTIAESESSLNLIADAAIL